MNQDANMPLVIESSPERPEPPTAANSNGRECCNLILIGYCLVQLMISLVTASEVDVGKLVLRRIWRQRKPSWRQASGTWRGSSWNEKARQLPMQLTLPCCGMLSRMYSSSAISTCLSSRYDCPILHRCSLMSRIHTRSEQLHGGRVVLPQGFAMPVCKPCGFLEKPQPELQAFMSRMRHRSKQLHGDCMALPQASTCPSANPAACYQEPQLKLQATGKFKTSAQPSPVHSGFWSAARWSNARLC